MTKTTLVEEYVKEAISKERKGQARNLLCLMLVANNQWYTTRRGLFEKYGYMRWNTKNAMDTMFDYLLNGKGVYECDINGIAKIHVQQEDGRFLYNININKAQKFASRAFPEETMRIVALHEGDPVVPTRETIDRRKSRSIMFPSKQKDITPYQIKISEKCDGIKKVLLSKNKRYGNSSLDPINVFDLPRESKIESRISDKLSRMKAMQNNKESSSYKDAVLDLIGYLILYHIALTEND